MSPQGPPHSAYVSDLCRRLTNAFGEVAHVRPQVPLDAGRHSLPEPDIAVVRGQALDYRRHHPLGHEVLLAIEIAYSSHALDRRKARIYAAAGVPVYWIVDLPQRRIEIHTQPGDLGYGVQAVVSSGEEVELPGIDARWAVGDILG